MTRAGLAALVLVTLACDPSAAGREGAADDATTEAPEPTLTFVRGWATTGDTGDPLIYDPVTVAGFPNGGVVVVDVESPRIVVLDSTGSVAARFGERGAGPGEVRGAAPGGLWPGPSGGLWIADSGNMRLSRFDRDGDLVHEVPVKLAELTGVAAWLGIPGTGDLFVQHWEAIPGTSPLEFTDALATVDPNSGDVVPIAQLSPRHPGGGTGRVLLAPRSLWTVLSSGQIIEGRNDSSLLRVRARDGRIIREIELPFSSRSVTEAIEREILDGWGELRGGGRRPEVYHRLPLSVRIAPINDSVFALQHARMSTPAELERPGDGQIGWTLVSTAGAVIESVMFPANFAPHWSWEGRVLGVARDSLGVARIEEYAIRL